MFRHHITRIILRNTAPICKRYEPGRAECIQHTDDELVRRDGLHNEALILHVADVGVGPELNLF